MPGPMRSGPILVRSGKRPTAGEVMSEARYLSASAVDGSAMTDDISSEGMSLVDGSTIQIESSGVYRFTYSVSFRPVGGDGLSANLLAELFILFPVPGGLIPGSGAKGGSFAQSGFAGLEWGTVSNSVIARLEDAPNQVVLVVQEDITTALGWRTFTAERIDL